MNAVCMEITSAKPVVNALRMGTLNVNAVHMGILSQNLL